jgi:hypothetical protein
VTVNPANKTRFEDMMEGVEYSEVGRVRGDNRFVVTGFSGQSSKTVLDTTVDRMTESYKSTFKDY